MQILRARTHVCQERMESLFTHSVFGEVDLNLYDTFFQNAICVLHSLLSQEDSGFQIMLANSPVHLTGFKSLAIKPCPCSCRTASTTLQAMRALSSGARGSSTAQTLEMHFRLKGSIIAFKVGRQKSRVP